MIEPDGMPLSDMLPVGDAADPAAERRLSRSDRVGIALSVLCAVHCAATPVLIAMLPTLGLSTFEQPWVHQALFVGCFLLAGNAVLRGFRLHGRRSVPGLAAFGLAHLAASAFVWPAPCCADGSCGVASQTATAAAAEDAGTAADVCHAGCSHCSRDARSAPDSSSEPPSAGSPYLLVASGLATSSEPAAVETTAASGSLRDLWLRLMTPLGGVLLIAAHLLNIRWTRNCACGCCTA